MGKYDRIDFSFIILFEENGYFIHILFNKIQSRTNKKALKIVMILNFLFSFTKICSV